MSVQIIELKNTANKPVLTVACESEEELAGVDVSGCAVMSKAYLFDTTDGVSEYLLSPSGDWCLSKKAPNTTEEVGE